MTYLHSHRSRNLNFADRPLPLFPHPFSPSGNEREWTRLPKQSLLPPRPALPGLLNGTPTGIRNWEAQSEGDAALQERVLFCSRERYGRAAFMACHGLAFRDASRALATARAHASKHREHAHLAGHATRRTIGLRAVHCVPTQGSSEWSSGCLHSGRRVLSAASKLFASSCALRALSGDWAKPAGT